MFTVLWRGGRIEAGGHVTKRAWAVAILGALIAAPETMSAGCNTIPEVRPVFEGVRGSVDRPFVRAGENDVITIDVPRPNDGLSITSVRDIDITLVVKPVNAPAPRTVFIAGDGKCERSREAPCSLERLFCDVEPDCIDAGPGGADVQLMPTPDGARVSLRVPASERVGPLTLIVTATDKRAPFELEGRRCREALIEPSSIRPDLLACIDEIVAISSGTPSPPPTPASAPTSPTLAFTQVLLLPGSNDFQRVCDNDAGDKPHCKGTSKYVSMTVESNGNLLIPMRWTNVLRPKGGPYERRQVRCSSAVEPFKSAGGRIALPGDTFLESWTTVGTAFGSPPLFVAQQLSDRPNELTLFGTTDKDDSVLRIWRRKLWNRACADSAGQACEAATAAADCAANVSCAPTAPGYYACVGGARDRLPCTRPSQCPSGQCKRGSTCVNVASGSPSSAGCTTDADCQGGEECGRGLFEFRDRAVNGAIEVPRNVTTGFAGVCDDGKDEGDLCTSALKCNSFIFGPARCVGYRAEAILFTQ